MKTCFKCHRSKKLSEFYKHSKMADGHLNKCKSCSKSDVTKNREKSSDYYKEFDRNRANNPERVAARKVYQQTDAYKQKRSEARLRWNERNQEKRQASLTLVAAVRYGKIIRKPCEIRGCGEEKVEGHHDDYSKSLEVRWLCDFHHKEHHKKERAKKRLAQK